MEKFITHTPELVTFLSRLRASNDPLVLEAAETLDRALCNLAALIILYTREAALTGHQISILRIMVFDALLAAKDPTLMHVREIVTDKFTMSDMIAFALTGLGDKTIAEQYAAILSSKSK